MTYSQCLKAGYQSYLLLLASQLPFVVITMATKIHGHKENTIHSYHSIICIPPCTFVFPLYPLIYPLPDGVDKGIACPKNSSFLLSISIASIAEALQVDQHVGIL